tara:strand:- start:2499 stop:3137 length:639 start_codon:yes stop_codon:yes gene_type:complete
MRGFIGLAIIGAFLFFIFSGSDEKAKLELSEGDLKVTKLDLERVLDLTVPVILDNAKRSQQMNASTEVEKDKLFGMIFLKTALDLTKTYNDATPKIYEDNLGVYPAQSGSLVAYEDLNKNSQKDETEQNIFFIDIDGENSRIIAESRIGASSNASFPAGSLLAGYFIGRMLTMQSGVPGLKQSLSNKQAVTPQKAISNARARAGSGSHRMGK